MMNDPKNNPTRYRAILLLGPTGSGKTPLGDICEQVGLQGQRCVHFDFGEHLRRIAESPAPPAFFSDTEMAVIRRSLATGALLENETFYIARQILEALIAQQQMTSDDTLILNGLPCHLGQAREVDTFIEINRVILLECSAQTIRHRIAGNSGGDRAGRTDDSLDRIQRKLDTFQERTLPLLNHYKELPIISLPVSESSTAQEMYRLLEEQLNSAPVRAACAFQFSPDDSELHLEAA